MLRAQDGTRLELYGWRTDAPRAYVALLHGYAEHLGRYGHVAEAFQEKGISLFGVDLRGHGRSDGARGCVKRFQEYHQDVDALMAHVADEASGAPVVLLGHSMGGLVALDWLLARPQASVTGLVLSSPFLGLALEVGAVKNMVGRALSRFLPACSVPSGLKGSEVAKDPKLAAEYDRDPLHFRTANPRWFTEAEKAMARVHGSAGVLDCPLFLLYAGADRVANAEDTERFFARLTMKDRSRECFDEYFHEIMNEAPPERAVVLDKMAAWILDRASAQVL